MRAYSLTCRTLGREQRIREGGTTVTHAQSLTPRATVPHAQSLTPRATVPHARSLTPRASYVVILIEGRQDSPSPNRTNSYAPDVVAKYGNDDVTGLPKCSGPVPPEGLEDGEAAGLGLSPASVDFPILQTYVDVCISGCLEHGEAFAQEFIATTFLWAPYWVGALARICTPCLRTAC